jgi:nitrate/TMAO reductase-like tetraheme cytochrome c subunit
MSSKKTIGLMFIMLLLAACSTPQPATTEPSPVVQETAPVTSVPVVVEEEFNGLPLVAERGEFFSGSGVCVSCHTGMKDEAGVDVSIDKSWSASMHANASKDPYYLATVRSEVEQVPEMQSVIEDKCSSCHMPMAFLTASSKGESTALLDAGFTAPNHPLHGLAQDSVSCNLCHQLEPDNFGAEESFSGGFEVDLELETGERKSYGPYVIDDQQASIMQAASGFVPMQGLHMAQSELCATCHNLVTPYVDSSGQVAGEFAEQAIYSEWLNSAYKDETTCLDCHMPVAQGNVQISITGGVPKGPFSRHIFAGGNAFMLNILRENGEQIGVTTQPAYLDQGIQAAREMMGGQSATLALQDLKLDGSTLTGSVVIASQTGHKFPAG